MLKIKSQNISLLTYVILFFCLVSLSTDLILTNKIFWGTLFILSFVFSKIHFKFKNSSWNICFGSSIYSIDSQSICFVRRIFSKLSWSFADYKVLRTQQ